MPQGIAAGAQLAFHLRAVGAGAEGGDQAVLVQLQQAAHVFEGDGQHRFVRSRRIDVPGHRGAAAIGDQQAILLLGETQQLANLCSGLWIGHAVGEHTELAFAHRQPVRQALAAGMQHAVARLADDQRMLGQARGRHFRQHAVEAGIGQRVAGAD
ncbi:hypothetical protein D3C78_649800 [compost metagenome]